MGQGARKGARPAGNGTSHRTPSPGVSGSQEDEGFFEPKQQPQRRGAGQAGRPSPEQRGAPSDLPPDKEGTSSGGGRPNLAGSFTSAGAAASFSAAYAAASAAASTPAAAAGFSSASSAGASARSPADPPEPRSESVPERSGKGGAKRKRGGGLGKEVNRNLKQVSINTFFRK